MFFFWPPFDSKRAQGWASFEVLPRDPPELYLSHVCPTTSLEATNTDVLISILLHCLFTLGLLCFSYSKWKGPPGCSPASQSLKQGQSRTGPNLGVRGSHAVTHPPLSNLGTYLDTPHTLFQRPNGSRRAICRLLIHIYLHISVSHSSKLLHSSF